MPPTRPQIRFCRFDLGGRWRYFSRVWVERDGVHVSFPACGPTRAGSGSGSLGGIRRCVFGRRRLGGDRQLWFRRTIVARDAMRWKQKGNKGTERWKGRRDTHPYQTECRNGCECVGGREGGEGRPVGGRVGGFIFRGVAAAEAAAEAAAVTELRAAGTTGLMMKIDQDGDIFVEERCGMRSAQ